MFDLARLNSNKIFELYYKGICSFKDIPEDCALNPNQWMQVKAELDNMEFIEAMNAYASLHLVKDQTEASGIRKALLEYCKLDTSAMVMLL